MKTLILLLLIPILISGQTVTEKIKAKFKQINDAKIERLKECEEATLEIHSIGTIDTAIARYTWIESFVSMWDSYAKECYADSTAYLSEHYIENNRLISKYHYTHKQPDPIGFIEFLRNKLKGE